MAGGSVDADMQPRVVYSKLAVAHFVAQVGDGFDRPARDASIDFTTDLARAGHAGRTASRSSGGRCGAAIVRALTTAGASHTVTVRARTVRAEGHDRPAGGEVPVVITVDRANFRLRLWKNLKLVKTYTIAVGAGRARDAGRALHDPEQAGRTRLARAEQRLGRRLAGKVDPAGARTNPIKARWMGIYDGAGIHGTDASRLARHGRLARLRPHGDPRRDRALRPGRRSGRPSTSPERRRARGRELLDRDLLPAGLQQRGMVVAVANSRVPMKMPRSRLRSTAYHMVVASLGALDAQPRARRAPRSSAMPASISCRCVAT